MRARYTAYVKCEVDFLLGSLHPDGANGVDRESTKAWAENADWHGLEILSSSGGGDKDETGEVEFVARHEGGRLHERSRFSRRGGRWVYVDGDIT